jgi:photosystem II stability/assembly factor-like uncharacterized protein
VFKSGIMLAAALGAVAMLLTGCSGTPLRHVAVGWQGGVDGGKIIRTSIYAIKWDDDDLYKLSNGNYPGGTFRAVAANSNTGHIVAVGRSTVGTIANAWYSSDMGVSWLAGNTGTGQFDTELYGVAYLDHPLLGDSFVAVGQNGTALRSINNGQYWVSGNSAVSENLNAIAFGNDRLVAVGDAGSMMRSFDAGQIWIAVSSGSANRLRGIAYGNGVFIVTGDNGTLLRSTDGDSWQAIDSKTTEHLHAAAFGYNQNGDPVWVAVGRYGTVRFSEDNGLNWVSRLGASPTQRHLYAVLYAMGKFVAVGENITLYTLDGRDWTIGTDIPGNYHHLYGIARP